MDEVFDVTVGREYEVLGGGIWETRVYFLIQNDSGFPSLVPAGLFECSNQAIPPDWLFTLSEGISLSGTDLWTRWVAKWGYAAFVIDPAHGQGLDERDPAALRIFREEMEGRKAPGGNQG